MKTALYIRCASKSGSDLAVQSQRESCQHYAALNGMEIVEEYVDAWHSGATLSRPGFASMIEDAKQHKFDCILTTGYDRLARRLVDQIHMNREFESIGISVCTVHQEQLLNQLQEMLRDVR